MAGCICPQCGTENESGSAFCISCGYSFTQNVVNSNPVNYGMPDNPINQAKSNNKSKGVGILFILAGIVVLAIVGLIIYKTGGISFLSSKKATSYPGIYYLKDNSLNFSKYGKGDTEEIKSRVFTNQSNTSEYYVNSGFNMSEDGKYVFFLTNIDINNSTIGTLSYQKAGDADSVEKIADKVCSYKVGKNKKIVYLNDKNELYLSSFDDSEKIAKNVTNYYVDGASKYVLWIDESKNLYYREMAFDKDDEKLDKNVASVALVTDGCDRVVYTKYANDYRYDLYISQKLDDADKVASGVSSYVANSNNGKVNMYYQQSGDTTELTLYDFIEDDYADDDTITKPNVEDYTSYTMQDSYWGLIEKEVVSNEYYEYLDRYNAKLERDEFRRRLKGEVFELEDAAIYFYTETQDDAIKVAEGPIEILAYSNHNDMKLSVTYTYMNLENVNKLKFSEVYEQYKSGNSDFLQNMYDNIMAECELNIATEDKVVPVELGDEVFAQNARFNKDKEVAYIGATDEQGEDYLYEVVTDGSSMGTVKILTQNLNSLIGVYNGSVYYVADGDEYTGDLYKDNVRIDTEVACMAPIQNENAEFLYYKGHDIRSGSHDELYIYTGSKPKRIAKDVYGAYAYDKNKVAVLIDYSIDDKTGKLKLYNGKEELVKIDNDVTAIVY